MSTVISTRRRWRSRLGLTATVSLAVPYSAGSAFTIPSVQFNAKRVRLASHGQPQVAGVVLASTATDNQMEVVTEEETTTTPTYLDDGFVFGLEGSGLERPKGKAASLVVEGDSLETEPYQVAMVAATMLAHFGFAAHAVQQLQLQQDNLLLTSSEAILVATAAWVLADLGSGIFHWAVDNYGNGRTPLLGSIIAAFQGHHSAPWTITQRGFCNNIYKLCVPFGIPSIVLVDTLVGTRANHPLTTLFFAVFFVTEILSQEFHKWSHQTKAECAPWMNWLQDHGLAVPRTQHALHHVEPFDGNYCIVSGVCNEALDQSGLLRWMEHVIFNWNGVESNAWKLDAELRERTLRGDYSLPSAN